MDDDDEPLFNVNEIPKNGRCFSPKKECLSPFSGGRGISCSPTKTFDKHFVFTDRRQLKPRGVVEDTEKEAEALMTLSKAGSPRPSEPEVNEEDPAYKDITEYLETKTLKEEKPAASPRGGREAMQKNRKRPFVEASKAPKEDELLPHEVVSRPTKRTKDNSALASTTASTQSSQKEKEKEASPKKGFVNFLHDLYD